MDRYGYGIPGTALTDERNADAAAAYDDARLEWVAAGCPEPEYEWESPEQEDWNAWAEQMTALGEAA